MARVELDARTLRWATRILRIDAKWWSKHSPSGESACLHNARRFARESRAIEKRQAKGKVKR